MARTTEEYIADRKRFMDKIISIYCRKNHGGDALCEECSELRDYAFMKIDKCGHNASKTRCKDCPGTCYSKEMHDRIDDVVEFSGPRMILHPILLLKDRY